MAKLLGYLLSYALSFLTLFALLVSTGMQICLFYFLINRHLGDSYVASIITMKNISKGICVCVVEFQTTENK